jgi:hypothetical protein
MHVSNAPGKADKYDPTTQGGFRMATGETGFDDVHFDLVSVQYHSL